MKETLDQVFMEALERSGADRVRYLDEACLEHGLDREQLHNLIRAHERAGDFLESHPGIAHDDWIGKRVGPFELVRSLGSGGSGRVYEGRRADDFDQRVAVKLLVRVLDAEEQARRFRIECEALSRLQHAHIASLLDAGVTDDGRPYLIMELVDGEPIREYCDARRLGVEDRLKLFRHVCGAVEYAHSNLVIHRDLKPGNVLVDSDGRVRLLDFGIAKLLQGGPALPDTMTTELRLTPRYASPEQLEGRSVTTQSDVYSLGVVLFEMLTGTVPYSLDDVNSREWAQVVRSTTLPKASDIVDDARSASRGETTRRLRHRLRGDLDRILAKALHPDIERRYASPARLADDLGRFLERRPVTARPDTLSYRVSKFIRRNPVGVCLGALAAVALVSAAVISTVSLARVQSAQVETEIQRHTAERTVAFLQSMISSVDPEENQSSEDVSVQQLLSAARPRIDEELDDQPLVAANLLRTLAQTYLSLGKFEAGEEAQTAALERLESELGPNHSEVGLAVARLARFAVGRGEFELARERAEDSMLRLRDASEELRIEPASQLADIHAQLGDYDAAVAGGEAALALARRVGGEEALLTTLDNLGLTLVRAGRPDQAPLYFEEGVVLARGLYGPRDTRSAQIMNNLGFALKSAGREAEALPYLRDGLSIYEEVFEPGSLRIAAARSNLGDVHGALGNYEESERLQRAAIAAFRDALGNDHPNTGHTTNSLAMLQMRKGEYSAAIESLEETIRIYSDVFGEKHRNTAAVLENLARCQLGDGRWAAAMASNQQALDIRREILAEDHPDLARSAHLMGRLYMKAEKPRKAEPWFQQAAEMRRELFPPHNALRVTAESNYASCLLALGEHEKSEAILVATRDALLKKHGPDHDSSLECTQQLRELYQRWGKPDRANALDGSANTTR